MSLSLSIRVPFKSWWVGLKQNTPFVVIQHRHKSWQYIYSKTITWKTYCIHRRAQTFRYNCDRSIPRHRSPLPCKTKTNLCVDLHYPIGQKPTQIFVRFVQTRRMSHKLPCKIFYRGVTLVLERKMTSNIIIGWAHMLQYHIQGSFRKEFARERMH